MEQGPTVFVIDDDRAVRDSLRWLIESVGVAVRTFPTAHKFLQEFNHADPLGAACVVADLRLPGMSGLELQEQLDAQGVRIPLLMITGHGDVPVAVRAMKAGAFDFIEKPFSEQLLLDRVRAALEQDRQQRRLAAEHAELEQRYGRLSPRERQVMERVVEGKLNKQIAAELGLSHKTIEVHRAHVMEKMQAASLAELVRMAVALQQSSSAHA